MISLKTHKQIHEIWEILKMFKTYKNIINGEFRYLLAQSALVYEKMSV